MSMQRTVCVRYLVAAIIPIFMLLAPAIVATAANKFWKNSVGSGNWSGGNNWSNVSAAGADNGGAPIAGDLVFISPTTDANRTITFNDSSGATFNSLIVNLTPHSGSNTTTLLMSANNLSATTESIGDSGAGSNGIGTFTQSGGTNTVGTGNLYLGVNATDQGFYNLSGTGQLFSNGFEYIGVNGTGTFTQSGGAHSISSGKFLDLGLGTTATGTYNLSAGSLTAPDEYVGDQGVGNFNHSGGTNTIANSLTIGFTGGATGTYTISGGTLSATNNIVVGSSGTGTLTIQGSGSAFTNNLSINSASTVNLNGGTLRFNTIGGTGSVSRINYTAGTIQLAGDRTFGPDATILTLYGSTPTIPAGKGLAIEGDLNTTTHLAVNGGTLTQLEVFSDFRLGTTGNPVTLSINNGGDASILASFQNAINHGSSIVVDGTGSTFANHVSSHFVLGDEGNAYVTVSGGGTMTTGLTAFIGGRSDDDLGEVIATVKGPGSTWNIGFALSVGGNGVMNIEDGALVNVGPLGVSVSDNAILNLNGGTIRFDEYQLFDNGKFNFNSGTIQLIGSRNIGTDSTINDLFGASPVIPTGKGLTVEGTATLITPLNVDGGMFTAGQLPNASLLDLRRGTLNLTNQAVTIGSGGLLGSTLDLNDDTTVDVTLGITNQGLVTGDGQIGGPFANSAAGELRGEPGKSLKLTGANNTNVGRINLLGGLVEFTQNLTNSAGAFISGNGSLIVGGGLVNQGTMNFAGTANIDGPVTNAPGGKIISGGGGATIFYDDVTNNGEIRTSTNGFTVFFGAVSGSGTFTGTGTVNFEGDLSPGSSPAAVNFAGDVVFGPDATLEIEIGGTTAGTQYDQINVAGDLTLGGTLQISLLNGFTPSAGQTFDVLNWGSLAGAFSSVQLPVLPGLVWNTSQLPAGMLSVAIPGDFNHDGSVDAADYVVWRKNDGIQTSFNLWRANFGRTAGSGSGQHALCRARARELGATDVLDPWLECHAHKETTLLPGLANGCASVERKKNGEVRTPFERSLNPGYRRRAITQ